MKHKRKGSRISTNPRKNENKIENLKSQMDEEEEKKTYGPHSEIDMTHTDPYGGLALHLLIK